MRNSNPIPRTTPLLTAADVRRLWMGAQGLLANPRRKATPDSVARILTELGFVQLDTIHVLARAHDIILHTRLDGYRPDHLDSLRESARLFEGWTHDASLIPAEWYGWWKPRFRRDRSRIMASSWWRNQLADSSREVCDEVLSRIRLEGPLRSTHFDTGGSRGPWWGWKPTKAALDFLWRTGELAVVRRIHFQKVYDLPERALPQVCDAMEPSPDACLDWHCATASRRLAVFTPKELAAFWGGVEVAEAGRWCQEAVTAGTLVHVRVESADGTPPQAALAPADWEELLAALPPAPRRIRLLAPFDPLVRDRARLRRRFGFEHRFEAFIPEADRKWGYYVLPILEGDRFVGRLDARALRDRDELEVRGLWWEPGVRPSGARRRSLEDALARLAILSGVSRITGI